MAKQSVRLTNASVVAGLNNKVDIDYNNALVTSTNTNTPRHLNDRFSDIVNVKDFGATGDGVTDDTAAIQAAVKLGGTIFFPEGVYCLSGEIAVTVTGTRLIGAGQGGGYRANGKTPYTSHKDVTTLLFVDNQQSNRKRVRTRYLARPDNSYPTDPAMSVCIDVQAEHVHLENLAVKLAITLPSDYETNAIAYLGDPVEGKNYGTDIDVGIFIGTRTHFTMRDCMVLGYFRKAGIWVDSSQSENMPRFADADGNTYPRSNVENGADGFELYNVLVYGGFWGVRIQGPMPLDPDAYYAKQPENDLRPTYYYDSVSGQSVRDYRGGFGISDVLLMGCSIYGCCHHTNILWKDFDPSYSATGFETTFTYGGALCVTGLAANPSRRIQGHRYIGTRLTSGGAYGVYLGLTQRDVFIGCMCDHEGMFSTTGTPIEKSADTIFGDNIFTKNTNRIRLIATNAPFYTSYMPEEFYNSSRVLSIGNDSGGEIQAAYHFDRRVRIGSTDWQEYEDVADASLHMSSRDDSFSDISFRSCTSDKESTGRYVGRIRCFPNKEGLAPFIRIYGMPPSSEEMVSVIDLQATDANNIIGLNTDRNTRFMVPGTKQLLFVSQDTNDLVLRFTPKTSGDGHYLTTQGDVRPFESGVDTLGTPTFLWEQLYAVTSEINTSDAREKTAITDPNESLMRAWSKVDFKSFKFIDAIEKKGSGEARIHFGVIAQQVQEAFASEGLDASKYALFCYDEWDDEYEEKEIIDIEATYDEEGNEVSPAKTHIEKVLITPAGNRYGIRYSEALALECAYQRWRLNKLEEKLNNL